MPLQKKISKSSTKFSLIKPKGMGGIIGSKGYRFQDGYIICNIPKWIADSSFLRFIPEATGDVDVAFSSKGKEVYEHVQVKDHEVGNAEFKKVIETFAEVYTDTKKVYRRFILACPTVSREVKSLLTQLERYKSAKPFYNKKNTRALDTTEADFKKKLTKLKLLRHGDFIKRHVDFEVGLSNFTDGTVCRQMFVASLAEHPKYKKKLHETLRPAYGILLETVLNHSGKVVESTKIHSLINSVLLGSKGPGKSTVLHIHNWTVEKFDNKASATLDWSRYFDRASRKVPDTKIWNTKLLPDLLKTRNNIAKTTPNRHIIFRGKCTLSTGIALGATFPEVGNWSFEIIQPPQTAAWRSDSEKLKDFKLKSKLIRPDSVGPREDGKDIGLIFNITGDALSEVLNYIKINQLSIKRLILVQPGSKPGNLSIKSDSEAISMAAAAKDLLKATLIKYKCSKTHLFFYGPLGLSILLGQKLTSVGEIQLYEFQEPSYKPSVLIRT